MAQPKLKPRREDVSQLTTPTDLDDKAVSKIVEQVNGLVADAYALYVKTIHADKAGDRHMRRWRPRAHGRATRVAKGLSHITIVLESHEEA